MNKFRNEMTIKLGPQEILLRPNFENIAMTETNVGGLAYLAWKFSKGSRVGQSMNEMAKAVPTLTECAAIIFYNQAATNPEDPTKKLYSLEEIWGFVQSQGMKSVIQDITIYLAKITAGQAKVDEIEEKEKAASGTAEGEEKKS